VESCDWDRPSSMELCRLQRNQNKGQVNFEWFGINFPRVLMKLVVRRLECSIAVVTRTHAVRLVDRRPLRYERRTLPNSSCLVVRVS